jgi:hypothetical protein
MVFLRGEADLGIVGANLDLGWMNADLHDARGDFWDIEAMVTVSPIPLIELFVGYRYVLIDAKGDVDGQHFDSDLKLSGWMIGGGISF